MTDEQMRIAIAESVGYKELFMDNGKSMVPQRWESPYDEFCYVAERLPDYLNNLNAMHQAEKVFSAEQLTDYGIELSKVVPCGWDAQVHWGKLAHATARQRCIAFLKTLNLWKD